MADGAMPMQQDEGYAVERLRRQYTDFAADKRAELDEQRTARHYYHGDQYTAAELKTLKERKQPIVTTPRLTKKINGIVGLLERLRQDPKAFPRTPQQEQGAELGTAIIRYALDQADWTAVSPEVCLNAAVNGIGGIELFVEQTQDGDADVAMSTVDPETFFYDQRSVRPDFSDARFMGIAKWVDIEIAVEMFPDKEEQLRALMSSGVGAPGQSEQTQDRETRWVNSNEKQIFLIEHWYLKAGQWRWCFYSYNVELDTGVSPWKDEKGKSLCRFVMFSANIDHDGDRYGFIRMLKSPTDETNARRSKALHIMHTRRIIMSDGAVADVEKVRKEAVRPDGVVVLQPGGPETHRFEFDDISKAADWSSQIQLLEESKNELENFGPNPELMGEASTKNQSGRAIALLQQAGIAELGPFILAYRNWKLRVYRAVWNIVQQSWTAEKYIRVTDDDDVAQFIQLNGLQLDEYGRPSMVNALGALDVDIILDEGPDTMNMMQDTFDTLTALAQNGAQVPPQVLIELSSLPQSTKKKLMEYMEQASQPNPLMVKEAEAKIAGEEAKVEETRSKTLKNLVDAEMMKVEAMTPEVPAMPVQEGPKPPSVSIAFKDLPPEAKSQALADAGIFIPPAMLAAYEAEQARTQMQMKQAQRPQPRAA